MILIAAGDENKVNFGILEHPAVIGGGVSRGETRAVPLPAHAVLRVNCAQAHVRIIFEIRKVCPTSEVPGADQRYPDLAGRLFLRLNRDGAAGRASFQDRLLSAVVFEE